MKCIFNRSVCFSNVWGCAVHQYLCIDTLSIELMQCISINIDIFSISIHIFSLSTIVLHILHIDLHNINVFKYKSIYLQYRYYFFKNRYTYFQYRYLYFQYRNLFSANISIYFQYRYYFNIDLNIFNIDIHIFIIDIRFLFRYFLFAGAVYAEQQYCLGSLEFIKIALGKIHNSTPIKIVSRTFFRGTVDDDNDTQRISGLN